MTSQEKAALKVVQRLQAHGHIAYFAGGWVRDFLLHLPSKDIDIATSAPPNKILDLFPHTLLVGLSFGVVIVFIDGHSFEISSFRKDFDYTDGRKPSRILFSTPEEDAIRRDFTINGMFFDPLENKVLDYVGGEADLKKQVIRAIGIPKERFLEDRLRMVRAARFAARFDFTIEESTKTAILEHSDTLFPSVAYERIWQEIEKMAQFPRFNQALLQMHQLGLLSIIFPELEKIHLRTLHHLLAPFPQFPQNTPLVLFLFHLFKTHPFEEFEAVLNRLKASNKTKKMALLAQTATQLFPNFNTNLVQWCHFLADPLASLILTTHLASFSQEKRDEISYQIDMLKKNLAPSILRMQKKTPLISSKDLMERGILPGKKMGELLKQAEKIAIEGNIQNKAEVIEKLCLP